MLSEDRRTQLDGIVQQMMSNQESDSDIQFVVNDFKSKYETAEQKGFAASVGDDFPKRLGNVREAFTRPQGMGMNPLGLTQGAVETLGQGAGFVNDIVTEGLKAGYRTFLSPEQQESVSSGIKSYMAESPNLQAAIQGVSGMYGSAKEKYPDQMRMLEAGANIAGAAPVVQPIATGIRTGAPIAREGVNIAKDLLGKAPEEIERAISGVVMKNLGKSIKLEPQGRKNWSSLKKYFDDSGKAVHDIVANKANLNLTDNIGEPIIGKLPETRLQALQAAQDTKKAIFKEFNEMNMAAGKKGAVVELDGIASELDNVINNKVLQADVNGKKVIEHAKAQQQILKDAKSMTPEEAQEWMANANERLKSAIQKGDYLEIKAAGIDVGIASMVNKKLGAVVEAAEGAGYKEARRRYGALTQFETGMQKAATAALQKLGAPNFFDVTSGVTLVHALATMNPATAAAGGAMEVLNGLRRHLLNPDTYVKRLFNNTEALMNQRGFKSKTVGTMANDLTLE